MKQLERREELFSRTAETFHPLYSFFIKALAQSLIDHIAPQPNSFRKAVHWLSSFTERDNLSCMNLLLLELFTITLEFYNKAPSEGRFPPETKVIFSFNKYQFGKHGVLEIPRTPFKEQFEQVLFFPFSLSLSQQGLLTDPPLLSSSPSVHWPIEITNSVDYR